MVKLKARAVKNRLNKYNIYAEVDGQFLPVGRTINEFEYSLLEWPTKEEAIQHILNDYRLELVD